jgi:hypothetical protein
MPSDAATKTDIPEVDNAMFHIDGLHAEGLFDGAEVPANMLRILLRDLYLAGRRDERERAAGIVQERALDQERRAMKADRDEVLGLDMYHRDRAGMLRDVESAIRQEPDSGREDVPAGNDASGSLGERD